MIRILPFFLLCKQSITMGVSLEILERDDNDDFCPLFSSQTCGSESAR